MNKQLIMTQTEIDELMLVEKLNHKRMQLILEYLKVCKLKPEDLCAHVNLSMSTYYRYKNYTYYISMKKYSMACLFFKQYMKDNKIDSTPELIILIKETTLNQF